MEIKVPTSTLLGPSVLVGRKLFTLFSDSYGMLNIIVHIAKF